jgi:tetratricopeptide (TPR) repeat protein
LAGVAYYERGLLRAEDGRADEARADLEKSRDILKSEADRSPDIPALSGDLGRTYAALARDGRARSDHRAAAECFEQARAYLRAAVERAPERVRERSDLSTVDAEMR